MGKITKTLQPKHEETLSPWLKDFVHTACSTRLPLLPEHLATFPTRWPFPRGDLYHWIALLNRFDSILECFNATYELSQGPQSRNFGCEVLLGRGVKVEGLEQDEWSMNDLKRRGYEEEGDRQLIEAVLNFTRVLLEHCGNRSIYASSANLNDLLHTTSQSVIIATLQVGTELAKRYQASVKRVGSHSRHVSTALLANHYNMDLARVQHLAAPFIKTPLVSRSETAAASTPGSGAKAKDKAHGLGHGHGPGQKNSTTILANDLGAIANSDASNWKSWADVKIAYSPLSETHEPKSAVSTDRPTSTLPATPTPLRRSTSMGSPAHQTPRPARQLAGDESSPASVARSPDLHQEAPTSRQHVFDLPHSVVASSSIHDLLSRCPPNLPAHARYEFLNRVRVAKALIGSSESRQQALAVRLLAVTNLAYIHQESAFMEKVMRLDSDETRRFQLVYQLAELIHPSADGTIPVPLWLQAIAMALLEAVSNFSARCQDVLSALNANVNHGILLYVIRKAVSGMKEDDAYEEQGQVTEADEWRKELFSLTQHLSMSSRIGAEMVGAGLMDALVEILRIRSNVARRNQSTILSFIDGLIWSYQNAFQAFFNGTGLDAVSDLLVASVDDAKRATEAGRGTRPQLQSSVVDYEIPFYQQQTLKWLLKFMHHMMTNSYSIGGNTDRLLRNLVDKSDLLASLRGIMQRTTLFGSVLWTNSVTVLSDFINNDPTSYAAIAESGMIEGFLESVTGRPVPQQPVSRHGGDEASGGDANTPEIGEDRVVVESDGQPHPPTEEMLASQKDRSLARGILASPDAILAVPQVLNSISLNNAGLEMVSSSRAFDSFFEIFESPTHVDCLEGDHHLAGSVGESFDELARHHPALRTAISDAVIDMAVRVRFLGKEKARTEGWGAKLVFGDAAGQKLTADEGLPGRLHEASTSTSGKEKSACDEDVEMTDESRTGNKSGQVSVAKNDKSKSSSSFTPFVHALALFLGTYLTNHTMKANFIQRGGIEVLLDVAELPSLPHDFSDSNAARKLNAVIFQVIDHSPVLGLPSLLGRAQAAIDALEPFTVAGHDRPYFMPFVESEKALTAEDVRAWDVGTKDKILAGTTMVKSLLNLQTLLKALCECFSSLPRSTAVQFYPANVFDYYLRIVKSVGPVLSASLTEEAAIHQVLPHHWWAKGSDAIALLDPSVAPETFGEAENVSATGPTSGAAGSVSAEDKASKTSESQPSRPSEQEQATARYKNFQTLQGLLHSVVPSAFPFFQQLGKALFPRRERDSYSRQKHIEIAQQLSSSILEQLRPSVVTGDSTLRSYHYWIIMLHTLNEMLMDSFSRSGDRSGIQVIMPVYIAFAEQGGLDILTSMARRFSDEIRQEHAQTAPNTAVKVCTFGLKKLLELFVTLVDGKYMSESVSQFGLLPRSSQRRDDPQAVASQLVLEARIAIFPVVRGIWDSSLVEKTSTETLIRIIDILKTVSLGDYEPDHSRLPASDVLKKTPSSFAWQAHQTVISQLSTDFGEELAREGVFRANGNQNVAAEYCRLHREGKGGSRHPVPAEDAYTAPSAAQVGTSTNQEPSSMAAPASSDAMAVDAAPELDNLVSDAVLGELEDRSSQDSDDGDDDDGDEEDDGEDENNDVRTDSQPNASASSLPAVKNDSSEQTHTDGSRAVTKHELDQQRQELRKDLISRSLDMVRAHPSAAIEVSELISATVFSRQDQEIREEVGTTLTSAITSLSVADGEEIDAATNGSTIAAYAHLFALLLRENAFLNCNLDNLRSTVDIYVDFLKLAPANSKEELPPWIPYILLIVELLLCHDERPAEATWKAPTTDNEPIRPPIIQKEEPILVSEQKENLLSCIMDLLPRLGKNDTLAISVLRVLVILTRQRPLANKVGEKKNLQRLFLMAKQLAGAGANQLKDTKTAGSIMIILRHIVEDEETVKQVMRAEIRQLFENPQRTQRNLDVVTYLRNLAPVALRSPDIFVEVTNEMTKLNRWAPLNEGNNRSHQLALKEPDAGAAKENEGKDESVEPAVQATEDLSLQDVKRSTETGGKEMSDARKSTVPRPVVENPDGVVHFLLCELLNYRDVDDKDAAPPKDDKDVVSEEVLKSPTKNVPAESQIPSTVTPSTPQAPESKENKDKKASKPTFKAEDHPIFIYRCFLLNCLSELLQSYNSSKVEFINFKRSAPLQTNTPVKPRSSALNYLIHDLLCHGNTNETADNLLAKKKAATSSQAQQVLVALVTRTGEKALDKHKDRFEFDDDPDLLFVRKFSLDTILRSYERASSPEEPLDSRYSKMQCLADLMNQIIGEKERDPPGPARGLDSPQTRSQAQLRRMMYEKGYLDRLTSSIADLDLNQVSVKRAVKHVLRVLRVLTDTAKELSRSNVLPSMALPESVDDEIASSSSMSDLDDDREETPDLYRNSALGMLEPRGSDDESDDEGDDDEEMYDGEYGDELDYGDEEISEDGENDVSDDEEEDFGEMGDIEGLHGDPGVVEVVMGDDDEDMEDDDDHDDDEELSEEDELDSDEMDDRDIVEEIVVDNGDHLEDDENSGWEDESDEDAADDEEDMDYEAEAQDLEEAHIHGMDRGDIIDNLARAVMDPDDDFDPEDMDDLGDHYMEDGRGDADDDEDDDVDDDEYLYDEDYPHDEAPPVNVPGQLGWDTLVLEPFHHGHTGHRHRHGQRSPFPPGFIAGGPRDPLGGMFSHSQLYALSDMLLELEQSSGNTNAVPDFRSYFSRRHRATPPQSNPDDGTNPLLRRSTQDADPTPRPGAGPGLVGLRLPPEIFGPGAGGGRGNFFESPMALLNDIVASLPALRHGHGPQSLHLSISPGGRGDARDYHLGGMRPGDPRGDGRRDGVYHEPQQAVTFNPYSTFERYEEEVRMIFGGSQYVEKAQKLANLILSKLVPPAMEHEKKIKAEEEERRRVREEERKKREEEERRVREAKEAEEKAEREKQEAEERAERERAAAEAVAPAAPEASPADVTGRADTSAMEGVEAHGAADQIAADVPRVVTTLRGEEVDITELGIDPDYLAALPEEFREEVIAQTVSSRRSQAREDAASGEQTEVFQEFLDALPEEMRSEIVQQERQEIRRRERDELRRQATGAAQEGSGQDMDAASILLTFPPELRSQVLMEQGEDLMEHLPPDMAAQVRVNHRPAGGRSPPTAAGRRSAPQQAETEENSDNKTRRKTVVQMLDKAGIATLLRLMFVSHQNGSIRNNLFSVLADVCENRSNRLEVVSTILLILQEGSTDMEAVDRSFSQLSLKAKRPKDKDADPRTPTQNLKRTLTSLTVPTTSLPNSEISPLVVVNQCLDLLQDLSTKNPHIPMLFLNEHESVGSSLKRSASRKGKGRDKDTKAHKYAINSLLSLLDRDLVMQSSDVMAYLADLLNKLTVPLATMERRRREAAEKAAADAKKAAEEVSAAAGDATTTSTTEVAVDDQLTSEGAPELTTALGEKKSESDGSQGSQTESSGNKRDRQMQVPVIPSHNLMLVVKVFVARECSSKTFQNTISTIKNLSAIPGAKATFGQELVHQAQTLSKNIVSDLDELLPHILKATSGTDIQGVALSKFSPGASEQNKLLRVLTALDHLFDNKKKPEHESSNEKQDLVSSLYQNPTFSKMWEKLGECLGAIRQRENMVNVATILLPLIESLMVVCKNTAMTETQAASQPDKEMVMSSPPPEDRMAGLFFNFTEDHRRILNELVRNNPKLMSGTFALLVKNPKVLEFDNKRNYFNRSVHSRANAQRASFPTLQLAVRREHVFHDSFRSLYFKSGEEMKYGKLSIRFHGEEGVDAGGVTREWFQVLARQMFDANYVLFTPVSSDRTTFHPNKLSGINDMHLMYFKFVGRIIGKALYEGRVIDCYFSRAVYKRMLGKSVSVKDMESFDPDYYKSLVWMLENDITDIITETFSVEDDEFGVTTIVDLCPDGRNIPVTEENKHDYVRLVVEHKLLSSVKEQMEHFLKGFHEIIPAELISIFNEQELELLISGLPDIDIDDWKSNTEYHNYNPSSQQIQWFWRAVKSLDKEELAKLLQFVTGTSKVPLNGFKELEGMNGVNRFNIHRDYGNKDRLPSSHTCFNQLDLPEYESYEALRGQLMKAITAGSEYFGFA